MKKLMLIPAIFIITLTSCTKKSEINQCSSQLISSVDTDCICKNINKKTKSNGWVKSKDGLFMFPVKIKQY